MRAAGRGRSLDGVRSRTARPLAERMRGDVRCLTTPVKIGAAAPGTPPDATAPLRDHARSFSEPGASESLATRDSCGFHESARISKSCHEIPTSSVSAGACGREPPSTEHGALPRGQSVPPPLRAATLRLLRLPCFPRRRVENSRNPGLRPSLCSFLRCSSSLQISSSPRRGASARLRSGRRRTRTSRPSS